MSALLIERRTSRQVNLKSDDIVNMGMADMADAVLLVTIDRGRCLCSSTVRGPADEGGGRRIKA